MLRSPVVCTVVSDMKSKSLDFAVVCGPVLAGYWQGLGYTAAAAASDELRCRHDIQSCVHSIVAITWTKLYDVSLSVIFIFIAQVISKY